MPKAEVLNSFAPVISPAKVRQNYLILITEFDLQSGTIYGNEVYSFGEWARNMFPKRKCGNGKLIFYFFF